MPPAWSSDTAAARCIHGCTVHGVHVGPQTRCHHYHSPRDVIAIRFACCGDWYPCHLCHALRTDHTARVWPRDAFDVEAILCGVCGHRLPIRAYLSGPHACPSCEAAFNPGCAQHRPLYVATDAGSGPPTA